jgi:hypothetical protein
MKAHASNYILPQSVILLTMSVILQVIQGIIRYLDIETLKVFRKVCKTWDNESMDGFLENTQVNLTKMNSHEVFKLLETVHNGTYLPYKNVSVHLNSSEFQSRQEVKKVFQFLSPLRDTVKSVHFHAWRIPSKTDIFLGKDVFYNILSTLEALEYLSLTHIPLETSRLNSAHNKKSHPSSLKLDKLKTLRIYKGMGLAPQFLEELLSLTPNLKTVILFRAYNSSISAMLQILIKLGMHTLTTLQISYAEILICGPMYLQIKSLLQTRFLLESLQVNFNSWEFVGDDADELKTFYFSLFLKYAPVLKTLHINHRDNYIKDRSTERLVSIPMLPKLKTLTLGHLTDFGNFEFLRNTPTLHTLILGFNQPSIWNGQTDVILAVHQECLRGLIPCSNEIVSDVKRLAMPPQIQIPSEISDRIMRIFPNLQKLVFRAQGNDSMYALYKWIPQLEDLELLQGTYITDVGIINGTASGRPEFWSHGIYTILDMKSKETWEYEIPNTS